MAASVAARPSPVLSIAPVPAIVEMVPSFSTARTMFMYQSA